MIQLHASCISGDRSGQRGILILGASGSGKSGLALRLMALGCALVADDLTEVFVDNGALHARSAAPFQGIEARGIGILDAHVLAQTRLTLVVDLDQTETLRLPPERHVTLLGLSLPVVHKVEAPHFPAAILHYMSSRRIG